MDTAKLIMIRPLLWISFFSKIDKLLLLNLDLREIVTNLLQFLLPRLIVHQSLVLQVQIIFCHKASVVAFSGRVPSLRGLLARLVLT